MNEADFSYLRVWRDEQELSATLHRVSPIIERLRAAFEAATGWVLDRAEPLKELQTRFELGLSELDSAAPLAIVDMSAGLEPRQPALHRQKCDRLAVAISDLLRELANARRELRDARYQLAASAPVSLRVEQVFGWAESIQKYLATATTEHGFTSAAIYVLDSNAQELLFRFGCGDAAGSATVSRRSIKECPADVEAMSGHAITLTRLVDIRHWQPPMPCRTAVCLPLSSLSNILGSIWFTSDKRRRISNRLLKELEL
ncbi:MAG TPA: hypothetical protein PKD54_09825, partial [Pirellulaceae bacterium]|nr:hypothetical protein [Pirellulaceae bacterium]